MIRTRNTTRRRGYSLIEVLIATTVLGLGTLGLIAILAGSATQQRKASMQNLSVGVVNNAEELLERMLGRSGLSLGAILEGQWNAVAMDDISNYLTVAPGYLLVDYPYPTTVYRAAGPNAPYSNGQTGVSASELNPYLNQLNYNQSSGAFFNGVSFGRLRNRRIDLESGLTVTVELLHYNQVNQNIDSQHLTTFTPPNPIGTTNDIVSLNSADFGSGLMFDRRENSVSGTAGIDSFNITPPIPMPGWFINTITVSPHQWRNDQLVSINDRLVTEPEPNYPGGERPILGYSALIRQADASTQLCFFTYTMRALSKPTENESFVFRGLSFVPPETEFDVQSETSVLREVELNLGYEANTQRYFFEIPASEERDLGWAIAQGQILMVSSRNGVVNNAPDPTDPGADFPVRVVANRNLSRSAGSDVIVAYLDRSPRIGGRTPIMDLTNPADRALLHAWAVYPVVSSRTDQTEWLLNVVDARVIQVANQ
ncbi:MAG: prepilin-type N-terminal cleavage/methylation domain-containing protein [Phycisphaeraceae bacterium]|nr:prepilin-type N-terminal cleavage/methylation domain-containing protein [Phycisphaeraceae bacterium]